MGAPLPWFGVPKRPAEPTPGRQFWPVPILVGCFFAPESPWWLVRHNQNDSALTSIRRLTNRNHPLYDPDRTLAMIVHTNAMEKSMLQGIGYGDAFTGINLRRTEIACVAWAIQNLCGSSLMAFSAGASPPHPLVMVLAQRR